MRLTIKSQVWTSARRRAHHTAWPFVHSGYKVEEKAIMSEINPSVLRYGRDEESLPAVEEYGTACLPKRPWKHIPTSGSDFLQIPMRIVHREPSPIMI